MHKLLRSFPPSGTGIYWKWHNRWVAFLYRFYYDDHDGTPIPWWAVKTIQTLSFWHNIMRRFFFYA